MQISHKDKVLTDLGVLVTRPVIQANELAQALRKAGATAHLLPAIEVKSLPLDVNSFTLKCQQADMIIATSRYALTLLPEPLSFPRRVMYFAIGAATAAIFKTYGVDIQAIPDKRYNSENLLKLSSMQQVSGKKILLLTGKNPRPLLPDTLRERGASLEIITVYERICPSPDITELLNNWATNIQVCSVTSGESLRNLRQMLGTTGWRYFCKTPLVVISPRLAEQARDLGYDNECIIAENASNDALMQALIEWRNNHV